jgi:hypothetical protein
MRKVEGEAVRIGATDRGLAIRRDVKGDGAGTYVQVLAQYDAQRAVSRREAPPVVLEVEAHPPRLFIVAQQPAERLHLLGPQVQRGEPDVQRTWP